MPPADLVVFRRVFALDRVPVSVGRVTRAQTNVKIRQLVGQKRINRPLDELKRFREWRDERDDWGPKPR